MGWYDSWESLVNIVGLKAATIYAHSVSTTNGCLLCSLFFISDLKELGLAAEGLRESWKEKAIIQEKCRNMYRIKVNRGREKSL